MTNNRTELELAQGRRDEAEMLRRSAMTAPRRIEASPARFHMLIEQGKRHARELHKMRRALETSPRLRMMPETAQLLLEQEIAEYSTAIERLQAKATAQIEIDVGALEYKRWARAQQRSAYLTQSFKDVPPGAVEFFRSRVARMNDVQKLAVYKAAQPWERLVIEEGDVRVASTPHDDSGAGILRALRGTREQAELRQLIAQDQLKGMKTTVDAWGRGAGPVDLAPESELAAEEAAIERGRREIAEIDDVGHKLDLADRFLYGELPAPDFDAGELQRAQLYLESKAAKLGTPVPPPVLP